MAVWYKTGTVSVTNGSLNVGGTGTLWSTQVKQGDVFTLDGSKWYEVDTVPSDTAITLKSAYTGTTAAGQAYAIIRNFTNTTNADLATSLAALLTKWHNREDELVNWLTNTGTVNLTKTDNVIVPVKTPQQIQNEWIGKLTKGLTNVDVTLTTTEAGNAFLVFTGTLTANVNVIVPTSQSHVWFVLNQTTGNYTVTVKTASGTGVVVDQNQKYALFCDGTNVSSVATNPIGTGQTNVPTNSMLGSAAYTNLESLVPNIPVNTATITSSYTVTAGDWGKVLPVSGTVTVTLPDIATMPAGFNVTLANIGTSTVTVNRTGSNLIDGQTSILLGRGTNTSYFVLDSANWRSLKAVQFGWKELSLPVIPRGYTNPPTWATHQGSLGDWSFSATALNEVPFEFAIPHDYAPGTSIYLVAHWFNAAATPNTGTVRWGFEYSISKSHTQSAFPAPTIVYVETSCPSTRYRQVASETTAIASSELEPGATVLLRVFRDGAHVNDTCTDTVFLPRVGLKHQADRIVTAMRTPGFYA